MKTLSPSDLALVTGGKTNPVLDAGSSGTGGGTDNSAVLTSLQGIQSSLKDLGKNQNQGLFGGPNGPLLLMTMAMAFSRRSETVVSYGRRGYYWQSSW